MRRDDLGGMALAAYAAALLLCLGVAALVWLISLFS